MVKEKKQLLLIGSCFAEKKAKSLYEIRLSYWNTICYCHCFEVKVARQKYKHHVKQGVAHKRQQSSISLCLKKQCRFVSTFTVFWFWVVCFQVIALYHSIENALKRKFMEAFISRIFWQSSKVHWIISVLRSEQTSFWQNHSDSTKYDDRIFPSCWICRQLHVSHTTYL